jgi:tetratricopeptide (TPR) repeat protein
VGALLTLADTTFEERDYRLAIKLYERALALNDKLSLPHFRLGQAYKYLRERGKAIRELETALSLGLSGRSEYKAHKMLGYEYKDQRNNAKAISHFRDYLKLQPHAADKDEIETQIRRLGGRVSN